MPARRLFLALTILATAPLASQAQTAVQLPTFHFFGASTTVSHASMSSLSRAHDFGHAPGEPGADRGAVATFHFFGASTTVSVPDQGGIYLGGVNSSASGSVSRGVPVLGNFGVPGRAFGNRGIGSTTSGGGVSISAQIHDFESMDRALLDQAEREAPCDPGLRPAVANGVPLLPSVEQLHRQQAAGAQAQSLTAESFFQRGQDAEAAGKANVAKLYYQMAARRAAGDLKDRALQRAQQLQADSISRIAAGAE